VSGWLSRPCGHRRAARRFTAWASAASMSGTVLLHRAAGPAIIAMPSGSGDHRHARTEFETGASGLLPRSRLASQFSRPGQVRFQAAPASRSTLRADILELTRPQPSGSQNRYASDRFVVDSRHAQKQCVSDRFRRRLATRVEQQETNRDDGDTSGAGSACRSSTRCPLSACAALCAKGLRGRRKQVRAVTHSLSNAGRPRWTPPPLSDHHRIGAECRNAGVCRRFAIDCTYRAIHRNVSRFRSPEHRRKAPVDCSWCRLPGSLYHLRIT
jgi:hypothetical protein